MQSPTLLQPQQANMHLPRVQQQKQQQYLETELTANNLLFLLLRATPSGHSTAQRSKVLSGVNSPWLRIRVLLIRIVIRVVMMTTLCQKMTTAWLLQQLLVCAQQLHKLPH